MKEPTILSYGSSNNPGRGSGYLLWSNCLAMKNPTQRDIVARIISSCIQHYIIMDAVSIPQSIWSRGLYFVPIWMQSDNVSNLYVWYSNVHAYPQSVWSRGLRESQNKFAMYGSEISQIGNVTSDTSQGYCNLNMWIRFWNQIIKHDQNRCNLQFSEKSCFGVQILVAPSKKRKKGETCQKNSSNISPKASIHSYFDISHDMLETCRCLVLNEDEIAAQAVLLPYVHKIIYLGKNKDKWVDLPQLMGQLRDAVNIFKYIHLDAVGIWAFDCSSAHKGLASDTLDVNKMNVNPGDKETLPSMLRKWEVIRKLLANVSVVKNCRWKRMQSAMLPWQRQWVKRIQSMTLILTLPKDQWLRVTPSGVVFICYLTARLFCQLLSEISLWIQFHWNAVEICKISWVSQYPLIISHNFMSYENSVSQQMVSSQLWSSSFQNALTWWMSSLFNNFFWKYWCYIDAYWCIIFTDCWSLFVLTFCNRKGFDPQQVAFATRIYKQHCCVGTVAEVLEAMHLWEECKKAFANP